MNQQTDPEFNFLAAISLGLKSELDLNGNYWEPTADSVVIDQRDESVNLGDNPTKGEADYSDILVTPHPDTPVCSR